MSVAPVPNEEGRRQEVGINLNKPFTAHGYLSDLEDLSVRPLTSPLVPHSLGEPAIAAEPPLGPAAKERAGTGTGQHGHEAPSPRCQLEGPGWVCQGTPFFPPFIPVGFLLAGTFQISLCLFPMSEITLPKIDVYIK